MEKYYYTIIPECNVLIAKVKERDEKYSPVFDSVLLYKSFRARFRSLNAKDYLKAKKWCIEQIDLIKNHNE